MILTRWINLRIGLIVLAAVLLQGAFFSYLSIFGTAPDVVPVAIAVIGLLGGALVGAVVGFSAGLLVDVVLLETLGVSSLVLLAVGYIAGRYRESFEIDTAFAPAAVTGALGLFAAAGFSALELTLGVETRVSGEVVGDAIVKGLLAFLLAYPVYPMIRLALRSALVLEEAPARRPIFRRRKAEPRRRRAPGSRMRRAVGAGGGSR
jgi:rod shape-determining protein MreD